MEESEIEDGKSVATLVPVHAVREGLTVGVGVEVKERSIVRNVSVVLPKIIDDFLQLHVLSNW